MKLLKNHWQLLVIIVAIFLVWPYPLIWPLKMLVVFLHEISHAVAAILTGGRVVAITLSPLQGGTATTAGGNLFVIASAGYIGSLLWGVLLFMIALRSRWDRSVVAGFGIVMMIVAALYMRELFAIAFTIAVAIIFILVAKFLPRSVNDLVLRVIGLTSMIYVPYDIFSDTLVRASQVSDARIIASQFGGPTIFWGLLWLVISFAVIFETLRRNISRSSNISFKTMI